MTKRSGKRTGMLGAILAVLVMVGVAGWLTAARESQSAATLGGPLAPLGANKTSKATDPMASARMTYPNGVTVVYSSKNDVSPALSSLPPAKPAAIGPRRVENEENFKIPINGHKDAPDTVVQDSFNPLGQVNALMPSPLLSFEGIGFPGVDCNCAPPDTVGDVGPNHYVQMVNTGYAIWDKSGRQVLSPRAGNSIWAGFGGECEARNDGDPIVLYDPLADRWLMSQFTTASPYHECIAISTSGDPTGTYYRYAFLLDDTDFPDYPHLGVWPDGYYMTENIFAGGNLYAGPQAYVFDRAKMLQGLPATYQTFGPFGSGRNPMLPADLDGSTPPPAGAPNTFVEYGDPVRLYQFSVNWTNPGSSSFTNSASLDVAGFTELCPFVRACIEQPLPDRLDGIGDRPMHRLAYRNFGTHESLVMNHAVDAGGGVNHAGVRWYEIRSPRTSPVIHQQGTYAPNAASRWMGSIAMDRMGNLAIGYSLSSISINPSLAYAGRLASDPLGTLPQAEVIMHQGQGSQIETGNRWGDYASLVVDPSDDCTFWFTSEYYPNNNIFNWRTRIGSFKFPNCTAAPPTATPTGPVPTATNTAAVPPTATATPTPAGLTCNPALITITAQGQANPYPSNINIGGMAGNVTQVKVLLSGYSHSFPDDTDVLLVGPAGQQVLLVSDAGGGNSIASPVDLLFQDGASSLPNEDPISSGTYAPTNHLGEDVDLFAPPAPVGVPGTALSAFNGTNPNGTWSLYIMDDTPLDGGSIARGWCLIVTTDAPPTPTNTSTPTNTATPANTATNTPIPTNTPTNTPIPTNTPTNTSVPTNTATNTPIPTNTPTNTATNTPVPTATPCALDSCSLSVSSVSVLRDCNARTAGWSAPVRNTASCSMVAGWSAELQELVGNRYRTIATQVGSSYLTGNATTNVSGVFNSVSANNVRVVFTLENTTGRCKPVGTSAGATCP